MISCCKSWYQRGLYIRFQESLSVASKTVDITINIPRQIETSVKEAEGEH